MAGFHDVVGHEKTIDRLKSAIRNDRVSPGRKVLGMVVAGIVLLVLGLLWNEVFPINKKMWTSSFVLVVGAYSVLIFALFYYLIDVCGWRRWTLFFTVRQPSSFVFVYLLYFLYRKRVFLKV